MHLSVVIPAYNEKDRITKTLTRISHFLQAKTYDYEIIIVDDGSTDQTAAEAYRSRLFEEKKLKIIKNTINKGKGFSLKEGILNSKGDYVLISDADLSTPIEELDKLFGYMDKGYDMVIGSRSVKESDVRIHQPWYRERMGKIFNFFVRFFLLEGFKDTQCGFKLFKGDIARVLGSLLKIDGFCFDVEMLYLAGRRGYKVKEAGVIWENSRQSKVKVLGSSFSMFWDLFRIKALHK